MYLSGVWSIPGGSKQVALNTFFELDQESITAIEVNFYLLNSCNFFVVLLSI